MKWITKLKTEKVLKLSNLEEGLLNSHETMIDGIQSKLRIVEKTVYFIKVYLALKKSVTVNDITTDDVEAFLNSKAQSPSRNDKITKPFGATPKRRSSKYELNTRLFNEHKRQLADI